MKTKKKYDFDIVEPRGMNILLVVEKKARECGGRVTGFELVGPAGGNPNFRAEVTNGRKFEAWLKSIGFEDPEEYRA